MISGPTFRACVVALFVMSGPALATEAGLEALPGVLVSRQLLEAEGLEVGDVIEFSAERSGNDARGFRIVDAYEPVPDPFRFTQKRYEARFHLPELLDLTVDPEDPDHHESVSSINIGLDDPGRIQPFAARLLGRTPFLSVMSTRHASQAQAFVVLKQFHRGIALVTVIGSTAFLLALMVIRADERREVVGILRLIGFTRRRVMTQVFLEGVLVSVGGALFGVVLAVLCQGLFNTFFQARYDTTLVFVRITPVIMLTCVTLAVPLGVLAGLTASWTLLRRRILALLRR